MGQTNQAHDRDGGSEWITEHALTAALIVYVVLSIPVYLWLEGPVGIAGTVDASLVVAGLILGSILFVPVIKSVLTSKFCASRVHTGVK
ncbi:hypothetical protein [Halorussus aquaticus]|uniref:Uncharacterized protein n=1 Tax=Halorussus aquaticus TaxID=2953748 RepID=A0ABD5Q8C7_9EURY|nr:hypothetical protein [Halorussus aquaticus]